MNLGQRLLLKLDIASAKLVAADNELFSLQRHGDQARLVAWQRKVVSDLIRLGYNTDPQLGNQLKTSWSDWLQSTDDS